MEALDVFALAHGQTVKAVQRGRELQGEVSGAKVGYKPTAKIGTYKSSATP